MTGVQELADRVERILGRGLPDPALRKLLALERLLADRGVALGLISERDRPRILERHILDSLRAAGAAETGDRLAYDLGSGGGIPGLPLAIAVPELSITCVEARRNRVAFIELAIDDLELRNARARPGRIEDLAQRVDLCFARALKSAAESWRLAQPLLRPGGRLVYFGGKGFGGPDQLSPELRDGPGTPQVRVVEPSGLESAGPLVIMGRP
ncbi:MAG: 16S rRNA (guanine(527)-N(7))-methyltransferase RsmG [Actinomycetota bacterium]